jgi:hypoxanthine phosphoribosyltransferase
MVEQKIKILDKSFVPFISEAEIQQAVDRVAHQIASDYEGEDPVFICILNGSFMFGADLLKRLDFPCQVSFVKMSSYVGTESGGTIKYLIGLNENESLYNRKVIIIEDIVDSGNTLVSILPQIQEKKPKDIAVATLLFKPDAYKMNRPIEYIGLQIPNDFIVGYGLDYNSYGRNLRDIYKIAED